MKAGELRNVVAIEQPTDVRSASGAVTHSWATFASVRAKVESLSGREFYAANEFVANSDFRITIRYYPGVTVKMRVNFKGRFFDILSISNVDEFNRELQMLCKEGQSQGNK